ncbi:MAG: ATP-binding protein [Archangium sp.]
MPNHEQSVSREQAIDVLCSRQTVEALPGVIVATSTAAVMVAVVLSAEVAWSRLAVWLGGVFVTGVSRHLLWRAFRARPRTDLEVPRFLRVQVVIGILAALWWGVGLLVAAQFSTSILVITTVLLALIGMMTGGVTTTAGTPRSSVATYVTSLSVPTAFLLLSSDRALHMVALMVGGLFLASLGAIRQTHRALRDMFRLRLENQDLLASEETARRDAERANHEKSRFLAAASHDARQPLHALGLFVDTLKGRPLEPQARQLVENVELAHGSLVSLHEGLLDLSAADSGAVIPRVRRVELSQLLKTLEAESAPRAKQRGLTLEITGPDLALMTDPDLTLRVLRNLVANALAYTERGRVLISVRRRGAKALLQVWDTGIGIAPADQPRIFEELFQVGNVNRNRNAGLGLGLSIVRRLARALGSDVTVRSTPGKGSVFSFTQPLAPLIVAAPQREAPTRHQTVLLVDDDGLTRGALGVMLESWGFEVVAAQSAEEALEYAAQLDRLDALVTDLWLPGRSGLSLLEEFRSAHPRVRRIVVSGDTAPEVPARVRALDAAFLRKPVRSAELQQLLVHEAQSVSA